MKRRSFITGLVSAGALGRAGAQPVNNLPRLAIFSPFEPVALMQERSDNRYYRVLFAELRRLGRIEGQSLVVERYGKEQLSTSLAALVAEAVRSAPHVVYVIGPGSLLFKQQTTRIPIVAMTEDPIAMGLVNSIARPGGNITGVSVDTGISIHGKQIELLREMVPGLTKLAFLTLRVTWESSAGRAMRAASEKAGIILIPALLDPPTSETVYRAAITTAMREGATAIIVGNTPDAMTNRLVIADLIGQARLPAMYSFLEFVEAGGLMAYSFDLADLNKRAANVIDAILRGDNPGDIPYYQSIRFDLSLNLKTANALGLTIPTLLLARADTIVD